MLLTEKIQAHVQDNRDFYSSTGFLSAKTIPTTQVELDPKSDWIEPGHV